MNYREVVLEDDKAVGDSGTATIDINVKDPITELIVRFKAKNYATGSVDDQPPELQISKIEIVDGGATKYSLYGEMAVAAYCFDAGKWPPCWYDEQVSANQRINVPIRFGRYLGDPLFGFDPTRLTNPQLKITWTDQALYLDDYMTLGVVAKVMEGVVSPSKCLMWKEVETFVGAASGVKTVDLWTDLPYRRMMIRSYYVSEVMSGILTHFKMDCDAGKLIPFDLDESEFSDILEDMFGPFTLRKKDMFDHAGRAQAWMGGKTVVSAQTNAAESFVQAYCSGWSYYDQIALKWDGTNRNDAATDVLVHGYFPHCTRCYQFGDSDDPTTWFNAPGFGDIDLKLTQGVASAECTVALQQPVSL